MLPILPTSGKLVSVALYNMASDLAVPLPTDKALYFVFVRLRAELIIALILPFPPVIMVKMLSSALD
jgi:hypothetical protein